jgi:uncharacterized protein (TIGR04255 family)
LLGLFFRALDETYTYTVRPIQPPLLPSNLGQEVTIRVSNQCIFYNQKISIQVSPNTFVFACLNNYLGWEEFNCEIEKALRKLAISEITKYTRVGIRYISECPNKDLRDCLKFNFTFGFPHVQSETTAFRSEFVYNGTKIILNLNNKVPVAKPHPSTKQMHIVKTSLIDIDVITDSIEVTLEELLNIIESSHTKEKEVFFGMLNDEYFMSLNPEY